MSIVVKAEGPSGRAKIREYRVAPRANWKGYLRLSLVSCPIAQRRGSPFFAERPGDDQKRPARRSAASAVEASMRGDKLRPLCCDCGIDTIAINEWFMIDDEAWEQAWSGRRCPTYISLGLLPQPPGQEILCIDWVVDVVPGPEILCIGCLEKRIGRTLCRTDFIDVPINDLTKHHSGRLFDRLTANVSHLLTV